MLFPSHEDVFSLGHIRNGDRAPSSVLLVWPECAELGPMTEIHLVIGTPVVVLGEKVMFGSNDLALEVGCESRMILSQAYSNVRRQPCGREVDPACLGFADSRKEKIRACRHA